MLTVLLMRSGRTAWEAEGRIRGALDIPLTPEGVEEVKKQAEQVARQLPRAVFCGTDLPAAQTADIVARLCKRRAELIEGLREMNLGLWQGLLEQEVLRQSPTAYRFWKKDPASVRPPAGESAEECHRRVSEAVRQLARENAGRLIVVVCSRLVAGFARCIAMDAAVTRLQDCMMPPAATELLEFR